MKQTMSAIMFLAKYSLISGAILTLVAVLLTPFTVTDSVIICLYLEITTTFFALLLVRLAINLLIFKKDWPNKML
jgi:hypothetical protein